MLDHLRQDPRLATLIDSITLNPPSAGQDVYFALLESIVSQQLSVKAADTIFNRFLGLFPDRYPHTDQVIALNMTELRAAGLSGQKSGYIQNVATFHQTAGIDWEKLNPLTDEEVIQYLTQIKGVGKWTVEMLLMFVLHRPDVLPVDDLGIQQAMIRLYAITETGKELKARMTAIAKPWQPYRTLACKYLWRWKDTK